MTIPGENVFQSSENISSEFFIFEILWKILKMKLTGDLRGDMEGTEKLENISDLLRKHFLEFQGNFHELFYFIRNFQIEIN